MGQQNKLFLPLKTADFLQHTLNLAMAIDCMERIIVINKADVAQASIPTDFQVIVNSMPELGQAHSVVLGTQAAQGEGYLYLPIDQPALTAGCLQPILEKADCEHIVYPVVAQKPVNPMLFGNVFRRQLLTLTGDHGGRVIRDQYPDAQVPVPIIAHSTCFEDIDTITQYQQFIARQVSK